MPIRRVKSKNVLDYYSLHDYLSTSQGCGIIRTCRIIGACLVTAFTIFYDLLSLPLVQANGAVEHYGHCTY